MSQIGLPFDWTGMGEGGRFIIGAANVDAVRHLESWRQWLVPVSVISGPKRSGRSTLAQHFISLSGGEVIDGVEEYADEALFHAWNRAIDSGTPLLLIADTPPAAWPVQLADLRSRLTAVPHVSIMEPDEALMTEVIATGLGRAGSAFAPEVPAWIAHRVERSYACVANVLDLLNRSSLSSGRKISVAYAKEALQNAGYLPIVFGDGAAEASDKE